MRLFDKLFRREPDRIRECSLECVFRRTPLSSAPDTLRLAAGKRSPEKHSNLFANPRQSEHYETDRYDKMPAFRAKLMAETFPLTSNFAMMLLVCALIVFTLRSSSRAA